MVDKNQLITAVVLKKKLDTFIRDAKQDLEKDMAAGDSTSAKFDLDGQTLTLGKVTVTDPKHAWKVTDPEALAAWAEKNLPEIGETRFVLTDDGVRDLLRMVTERNGAFTDEGELIPGVEWAVSSNPFVKMTPAKDVDDVLALLAHEGRLRELTGFLELEQ